MQNDIPALEDVEEANKIEDFARANISLNKIRGEWFKTTHLLFYLVFRPSDCV